MYRLEKRLNEEELRQLLDEREVGNMVRFYRSLRAPGSEPGQLGWVRKETSDSYAVKAGAYNEEAAHIETTVEILGVIGPSRFDYEGPETRL